MSIKKYENQADLWQCKAFTWQQTNIKSLLNLITCQKKLSVKNFLDFLTAQIFGYAFVTLQVRTDNDCYKKNAKFYCNFYLYFIIKKIISGTTDENWDFSNHISQNKNKKCKYKTKDIPNENCSYSYFIIKKIISEFQFLTVI